MDMQPVKMLSKVYRGSTDEKRERRITVDGAELPLRLDLANHSPTGFAWGYSGSGPAQAALAICADFLGDDEAALLVYQGFKARFLAGLATDSWELTGQELAEHIERVKYVEGLCASM